MAIIKTASARASRLMVAVIILAIVLIGLASLYMVQMPGRLSNTLASMFTF